GTNPWSVAVGDLDGDQDLDLATANYVSGTVSVLKNQGDGTFAAATNYAVGSTPRSVAVGDVDGDQDLDLVVANFGTGTVTVLKNDGVWPAAPEGGGRVGRLPPLSEPGGTFAPPSVLREPAPPPPLVEGEGGRAAAGEEAEKPMRTRPVPVGWADDAW